MELIFAAILGFGIFLVFISFIVGQQLDPVQARLQQIAVRPRTLEELELQRPIGERTIKPIVQGLSRLVSRFYPANTARSLQIRLKRAGMETTSVEFLRDVKELQSFISAIIQADQLGVSMSKVLRIQSETLRTERRQRAEEKAARAPILIMLPTVGCIFPSLFIVILAPAALSALSSCGSV